MLIFTNSHDKKMATEKGLPQSAYADTEAAREQRKKKRTKCFLYIALFVVFQTAVITLFALTVMKVKTPKFRLLGATFTSFNAGAGALQATMVPQFSVENTNFGCYKYRATTVEFFYGDAKIGEAAVRNSKTGWRSTKRFLVPGVDLSISSSPQLSAHLSAGVVPIRSSARMTGRVELMFIMKKNRATNMNCTMDLLTATNTITNILCK